MCRRTGSSSAWTRYKELLQTECDIVFLATPPGFRPLHFDAAIEAGKHVFAEKPVAVDAAGVRKFLAANEEAKKKGLAVAIGLQRRHERKYMATVKAIQDGAIGDIVLARAYWNGTKPWWKVAAGQADRNGVPDAELVQLQLAVRRPHRRAAHPQPGRHQLDQERLSGQRPGARGLHAAGRRNSARFTTTTSSNSPTATAR